TVRTYFRHLQLRHGEDEKATGRANLRVLPEFVHDLHIELSQHPRVNLVRDELARLLLDVHDVLFALLDARLVRNRQERALFDDDLHDVKGRILPPGGAQPGLDYGAAGTRTDSRAIGLVHRRLPAWRDG